jgi:hypothetical protein
MRTRWIITVLLAGLLTGGLLITGASAGEGGRTRHRTSFVMRGPVPTLGNPFCDAEQRCLLPGTRATTYEGDWVGTGIVAGAAAARSDGHFAGTQTWLFSGSVEPCGSGTMVLAVTETGNGPELTAEGSWRIVAGFGTGDLTDVSGRGTGGGGVDEGVRAKGVIRCSK